MPGENDLANRILAELRRKGCYDEHDPKLQPSLLPVALEWLEHWTPLLVKSPSSALGPLASLLAVAIHEAQRHSQESAEELAKRLGFKPHGKDPLR